MTTVKKAEIPPKPYIDLGQLREPMWKFRILFADGESLDVVATRDDSTLRALALKEHYGKEIKDPKDGKIEGVARIEHVGWTEAMFMPVRPKRSVPRKSAG